MCPNLVWISLKYGWTCPNFNWVCPYFDWMCPYVYYICPNYDWICPIYDWISPGVVKYNSKRVVQVFSALVLIIILICLDSSSHVFMGPLKSEGFGGFV